MNKKKLVLFGAGKIGRSFIAQLFSRGGYEVVFIDIDNKVIDELNRRRSYYIVIKSSKEEKINIKNVRGLLASDFENIVNEISDCSILAVSVGINGLNHILPLIAKGLLERYRKDNRLVLDIIIAENLRNAAEYLNNGLKKHLPQSYPIDHLVGLVETSIGKMVPIMPQKLVKKDILLVYAEPYNTLILDKKAFKNLIPAVEGLAPKENMKAWVDRKLFIHNLGHATTAYLGNIYNPRFVFIYEALSVSEIFHKVRETMLQAADILLKKYPEDFTVSDLTMHIDDLLQRFRNQALGDTIFRVGCGLKRKLGAEDRLAGAIHLAVELKLPYDKILHALVCGCHFNAKDEDGNILEEDIQLLELYKSGLVQVLTNICGFNKNLHRNIFSEAEIIDSILNKER